MQFVYTYSFYGIFLALYLKSKREKVTVISSSDDVLSACGVLNLPTVRIQYYSYGDLILKRRSLIAEIDKIKKILENDLLHFSHLQYDLFCFTLITNLIRTGFQVQFDEIEMIYPKAKLHEILSIKNLFLLLQLILFRICYNVPIKLSKISSSLVTQLNLSKFNNFSNFSVASYSEDFEDVKTKLIMENQIKLNPIRNVFIEQSFGLNDSIIEKKTYEIVLECLSNFEVSIKPHPNNKLKKPLSNITVLPGYLPVEFLFSNVTNAVISVNSLSLINASKNNNLYAISIMELLRWKDNNYKIKTKEFLINKSGNKILFPKTLFELEESL